MRTRTPFVAFVAVTIAASMWTAVGEARALSPLRAGEGLEFAAPPGLEDAPWVEVSFEEVLAAMRLDASADPAAPPSCVPVESCIPPARVHFETDTEEELPFPTPGDMDAPVGGSGDGSSRARCRYYSDQSYSCCHYDGGGRMTYCTSYSRECHWDAGSNRNKCRWRAEEYYCGAQ